MLTTPPEVRDAVRASNRGNRVYTLNGKALPSVTSIVSNGEPKPVLVNWAKKVTAEAAIAQHDLIGQILDQDGERAAIDHLKGAAYRQRDAAGELGAKLHEVAEYEILMGTPYPEPGAPEAQRLLSQFRDFVKVMAPDWHAVEAIVFNETYGYAGTLDAIATLHNGSPLGGMAEVPIIIDWKSGTGVYGSYAMQLAAYAHAEFLLGPGGPVPLRGILPEPIGAVVHITPTGWSLVRANLDQQVFDAFIACMTTAIWTLEDSRAAVGEVIAHGQAGAKSLGLTKPKADAEVVVTREPIPVVAKRKLTPPVLGQ